MTDYPPGSVEDREMLVKMPVEKLLDFFFLQIRNIWRVDGLYFLGMEEKFGTKVATEIDTGVLQIMAQIEAKSLWKMFQVGENADVPTTTSLLLKSSWALDQPFKTIEVTDKKAVLSINRCRTQEARLKKGLSEFPCKKSSVWLFEKLRKDFKSKHRSKLYSLSTRQTSNKHLVQMGI